MVEHEDACGQVGQHALKIGLRLLECCAVLLHRAACVGKLARHLVELLRQHAELVARVQLTLGREIALGHLARALQQHQQRSCQLCAQQQCQHHRDEHREEQRERERADVHLAQAGAAERFLLVFLVRALDRVRITGERLRHRLYELQEALFAAGFSRQAKAA